MKQKFVVPNHDQFKDELISQLLKRLSLRVTSPRKKITNEFYSHLFHFGQSKSGRIL